jgi:phage repressor protein C with HTH and peptisase S24 domain
MVLMRVDGDSMEPEIHHGDVVLIDQSQTTPRAGAMFAVGVEDLVYIKMVDALPGKIILKSCNDSYRPLEIDARGDLADGIRIVGKAVWLGRELR